MRVGGQDGLPPSSPQHPRIAPLDHHGRDGFAVSGAGVDVQAVAIVRDRVHRRVAVHDQRAVIDV